MLERRLSRRTLLKTGVAGAASLGLPFGLAGLALADVAVQELSFGVGRAQTGCGTGGDTAGRAARVGAGVFTVAAGPGQEPGAVFPAVLAGGGQRVPVPEHAATSAPLLLTGLAFAAPATIGLTAISAEGVLVLGRFAAAAVAVPRVTAAATVWLTMILMAAAAMKAAMKTGALWTAIAGWLRHARGVNETISTLLLTCIATAIMNFLVEGLWRDPGSANKPSTMPISKDHMVGAIPRTSVHWGADGRDRACDPAARPDATHRVQLCGSGGDAGRSGAGDGDAG